MREDAWLAERLGRPCFALEPGDSPAIADAPGFWQAKVPAVEVARVGELETAGFRCVDVNVTLRRADARPRAGGGPEVVAAAAGHRDEVLLIAADDFTVSRFHLDPQVSDDAARRIKRDWAAAVLDGTRGDGMLVALGDGVVDGFLARIERADATVIDLIAVRAGARRTGAGAALVEAAQGAKPLEVGTQVSNAGALAFYEALGFRTIATTFVLHCHR